MDLWSLLSRLRPVAFHLGVVLVVLGVAVTGVTGYTHLSEPVETVEEPRQVPTVTAETEYRTSATVTGNSSLYDRGTRLENASSYVLRATPAVDVSVVTGFDAEVSAVDQQLWLEYEAVRDGETFWDRRTLLDRASVESGEAVVTRGTLDGAAIAERRQRVRDEIAGQGDVRVSLVTRTSFEDPVTGADRVRTQRYPLTMPGGALLSVSSPEDASPSRTYTTTRTVVTEQLAPVPWLRYGAGVGLAILGLALLWVRDREAVLGRSIARTDEGEWERTIGRYSEWISTGSLVHHESEEAVPVEDIPELVKVAMNNRGGLVHCETTNIVAYLDDGVTYYCRGPDSTWDPQDTLRSAFEYQSEPSGDGAARTDVASKIGEPASVSTTSDDEFRFGGEDDA